LGFKGEFLDLEVEIAPSRALIADEEERIKKIVEDKAANKMGRLFKLGCHVANERVVTESCRQIILEEEKVKAERLEAKIKREDATKLEASHAYSKFVAIGKSIDDISARDSKSILKFLLPKLAPNKKISDYNTGPKAVTRLNKFAIDSDNKITWEAEMKKYTPNDES